jgi:hypothetical protein
MNLKLDYKIGEKLDMMSKLFTVVGVEYFPNRANRYIVAHACDGTVKWEYLYKFEIEIMLKKPWKIK